MDFNQTDAEEAFQLLADAQTPLLHKLSAARALIDSGWSSEAIGQRIGQSASTIRHLARLLSKLAPAVVMRLEKSSVSFSLGHLKALAALPHAAQLPLMERCLAHRYSVRKLETLVQSSSAFVDRDEETYYQYLSEQMSLKLGFEARVRPDKTRRGAGKITLPFHSLDEFDALCARLRVDLSDL